MRPRCRPRFPRKKDWAWLTPHRPVLSLEFQGHQAEGKWICGSQGGEAPPLGSFRGGGSLVEAPALDPVFSPVARSLNPP